MFGCDTSLCALFVNLNISFGWKQDLERCVTVGEPWVLGAAKKHCPVEEGVRD